MNLEMKFDGEKVLLRHPGGVTVMIDFSDVRPDLAAGAVRICGVKVAAKPSPPAPPEPVSR